MDVIKRLGKELIIAVILIFLILLGGYFLFRNTFSFLSAGVPNAVSYTPIDYAQYNIKGDVEDQKDPTKTYQNTTWNLQEQEYLRKVHTGSPNPFSGALDKDPETDIPSEKVDIINDANPTEEEINNMANELSGGEEANASQEGAPSDGVRSLDVQ